MTGNEEFCHYIDSLRLDEIRRSQLDDILYYIIIRSALNYHKFTVFYNIFLQAVSLQKKCTIKI